MVTKRLFGDDVVDRLAAGKITAKRLLLCIRRMFKLVARACAGRGAA